MPAPDGRRTGVVWAGSGRMAPPVARRQRNRRGGPQPRFHSHSPRRRAHPARPSRRRRQKVPRRRVPRHSGCPAGPVSRVCLGACHSERVVLPADNHVHSEWSYDAPDGDMERTCERAVELGLPAIALTEHADHTRWRVADGTLDPFPFLARLVADGALVPPELDVEGYLSCLERCRDRFPGLRIVSGVELGEPHWHSADAARLLADGRFDRVLGSLHCLPTPDGSQLSEIGGLYRERDWADVVRDYLAEIVRLIDGFADFAVLAHIDYAVRYWPDGEGAFDPRLYEEEFRAALRA